MITCLSGRTCTCWPERSTSGFRDGPSRGRRYSIQLCWVDSIPGFAGLGPEADLASVSAGEFVKKVRARHSDIRNLLMDQEFLAGIGNAYADEILFRAGIHPKRPAHSLSAEEAERIHLTIKELFAEAEAEMNFCPGCQSAPAGHLY